MAAIANLILQDAASTPFDHTFIPQDCTSDLATWIETTSGISIGMPTATMSLKFGRDGQANKLICKLVSPTLETVSGADASGYAAVPQLAYSNIARVELTFPARATLQNRKDLKKMIYSFLGSSVVLDAVTNFERPR